MTKLTATFTADVTIYDGTDENQYGEETLEGHGYYVESGYVNPDDPTDVWDDASDVPTFTYDADTDGTIYEWMRDLMHNYAGSWQGDGDARDIFERGYVQLYANDASGDIDESRQATLAVRFTLDG